MKTDSFTPSFFLVRNDLLIKLSEVSTIGRAQGNVVLEDDTRLSSAHCELVPTLTKLSIKDLGSTNGVFVNKVRIPADEYVELSVGDIVLIGSHEYKVCDNEKDAKVQLDPVERRRRPRPESLVNIQNLANFFAAPKAYRGMYLVLIVLAIGSAVWNLQLDVPVPEHLAFLTKIYREQIIYSGIRVVFFVWLLSLIHSFSLALYFNRNHVREGASLVLYLGLILFMVDYSMGPLGDIKRYLVSQQSVSNLRPQDKPIIYLLKVTTLDEDLTKAYRATMNRLGEEERQTLRADYKKHKRKLNSELKNLRFPASGS